MKYSMKILLLFCLSLNLLMTSGCGKDEEENCSNFPLLSGTMEINGDEVRVSAFQSITSAGGVDFGDSYSFQVAGVSDDCNTLTTFSVNFIRPSGISASGTYDIKEFIDAGDDDASGSVLVQTVDPISQSFADMISGTLTVSDKGDNQFDLDLSATLIGGSMITMSIER